MSSETTATQYKVTVQFPEGINATFRNRAGIKVHRAHGFEGELTKAQIKAIDADPYLALSTAGDTPSVDGSQSVTEAETKAADIIAAAEVQAKELVDNATSDADKITQAAAAAAKSSDETAKAKGEDIVKAAQAQADKITKEAETKATAEKK